MRHLGSILLSLVLAAGVYVLVGIGSVRLGVALAITGHDYTNEAIGAAALLAAGALYAAMVLPRLSPLGPLLAALAFLGVEVYALVAREQFAQQFDKSLLGAHGALAAPVLFGVPLLLAVPLLATMLSPQRWRGTAGQPAAAAPYGAAPYAAATGVEPGPPAAPDTTRRLGSSTRGAPSPGRLAYVPARGGHCCPTGGGHRCLRHRAEPGLPGGNLRPTSPAAPYRLSSPGRRYH